MPSDQQQCKSEGFDSCDRPNNLTQIGFNHQFYSPCDLEIWWMTSKNYRAPLLHCNKLCASFQSHRWIKPGVTVWKHSIRVKICDFFIPCDLEIWWMTLKNSRAPLLCCFKLCSSFHSDQWIQTKVTVQKHLIWVKFGNFFVWCDLETWWMTLKNNRAPLLCYMKLCTSFESHRWIQTGVTVRKPSIRVKIGDFLSCVTLKFDRWPSKTIGHLFYAISSFVLHFIAISELKLKLQSGNAQFGSKSAIFLSRMTLKFDGWPWKRIGQLFYAASSFLQHCIAIGKFKLELQSGNAQLGSKLAIFLSHVTLKLDEWPWKTIGHLF